MKTVLRLHILTLALFLGFVDFSIAQQNSNLTPGFIMPGTETPMTPTPGAVKATGNIAATDDHKSGSGIPATLDENGTLNVTPVQPVPADAILLNTVGPVIEYNPDMPMTSPTSHVEKTDLVIDYEKLAPHMPKAGDADYANKKMQWMENYPDEYKAINQTN